MDFQKVVARRRMVRHFAPDPIDRAVLERIARTAQRPPFSGSQNSWLRGSIRGTVGNPE